MDISSPSFSNNEQIPRKFGCGGENVNPEILIRDYPKEAKSLAIILEDPDAPRGIWTHWIMWNINPQKEIIGEGETVGILGTNDYGNQNYDGPCPPSGTHRYFFKAFALDKILDLPQQTEREGFYKSIEGHIIDNSELMGTYSKD